MLTISDHTRELALGLCDEWGIDASRLVRDRYFPRNTTVLTIVCRLLTGEYTTHTVARVIDVHPITVTNAIYELELEIVERLRPRSGFTR